MINFRKTVSQIYFDSVNTLFEKLYNKLDPQSSTNNKGDKSEKSAKETFCVILIILTLIGIISFLISLSSSWEIPIYNSIGYLLSIYIAAIILTLFGFFLVAENKNSNLLEDYKSAAEKWNVLNLKSSEKKREIQEVFNNEYSRDLRYGELQRIINYAEKGISFRYDDYLYNDRLLFLKIFFYGPLLNDWDNNFLFSKLFKASVTFTFIFLYPIIISLSYLFQEKLVNILYWYVMRNISPKFENNKADQGDIKRSQEKDFKKICKVALEKLKNENKKINVTNLRKELPDLIKESDLFPSINNSLHYTTFHKNEMYKEWVKESTGL